MAKHKKGFVDYELIGKKFGKLTIVEFSHWTSDGHGHNFKHWKCRCDCGNEVTKQQRYLTERNEKNHCGCIKKMNYFKHGETQTRLFRIWVNMRRRCRDEKGDPTGLYFKSGVRVCDEWQEYIPFKDWSMKNGYKYWLTIDRYPNKKGNYEPSNCRWGTWKQQQNNRNNNRVIEFNGQSMNITEWADSHGMNETTLDERIKRGWTFEQAITKPVKPYNRQWAK